MQRQKSKNKTWLRKNRFKLISLVLLISLSTGLFYMRFAKASQDETQTDTDKDGLTDAKEKQIKTDPTKIDTDGDSLTDSEEYRLGMDPLTPFSKKSTTSTTTTNNTDTSAYLMEFLSEPVTDNSNLTNLVAEGYSRFETVLNTNSGSVSLEDLNKIVDGAIPEDQLVLEVPTIKDKDIKITEETTKENLQAYYFTLFLTLYNNLPMTEEEKTALINNGSEQPIEKYVQNFFNGDTSMAIDLQLAAQKSYGEIIKMSVPKEAVAGHKVLLQSTVASDKVIEEMTNSLEDDPVRIIVGYEKFRQIFILQKGFWDGFTNLKTKYNLSL